MDKQARVLELLKQLRSAITPEIDGMLCELEVLTDNYPDFPDDGWFPSDAEGQAVKDGARHAMWAVNSAMHQVMNARAMITETLFIQTRFTCNIEE